MSHVVTRGGTADPAALGRSAACGVVWHLIQEKAEALHQSRHYSAYLALQLKARMEGLETPVYELQPTHHTR